MVDARGFSSSGLIKERRDTMSEKDTERRSPLEKLRLAIMAQTGETVSLEDFELEADEKSGRGTVSVGGIRFRVRAYCLDDLVIGFQLDKEPFVAYFDEDGGIRAKRWEHKYERGEFPPLDSLLV